MSEEPRVVLFLCTGNYYRSRFAELLFNARARARDLNWRADSAGLAHDCGKRNMGLISRDVLEALERCDLPVSEPPRPPRDVTLQELLAADRVVALCEREHRPMLSSWSIAAAHRAAYWDIEDVYLAPPRIALAAIEERIESLLDELGTDGGRRAVQT